MATSERHPIDHTTGTATGQGFLWRLAIGRAGISIDAPDSGLRRRLVAQADGTFEIAGLRPGGYHLRVEAEGFRPKELHVQLEVNERARVDVTLTAKGIEETID